MKSNRWCFTSPTEPNLKLSNVNYLVYQEELGELTKFRHFQGYVEFHKEYSLQYVKSLFKLKTIHLEIAKQSREINILYCTKSKTRIGLILIYNSHVDKDLVDITEQQELDLMEAFKTT